jgi:exo-beta-1,3-glucanase (GH17 family)
MSTKSAGAAPLLFLRKIAMSTQFAKLHSLLKWTLCVAVLSFLGACGESGVVPVSGVAVRSLSAEFTSRKAVAYSPFRSSNRSSEVITEAMVKQDLDLLIQGGFTLIRLFDSSDAVAKMVLQTIQKYSLDMRVQLGIYVLANDAGFNQAEIARGIALANQYRNSVLAVSVGNETMVSWSFNALSPAQMAGYIKTVRDAITQPVTTNDNWAFYANAPSNVLSAIDFAAVHTYPLADSVFTPGAWDWQQAAVAPNARASAMMDAAIASAQKDHNTVRAYFNSLGRTDLPIVIGETGWKAIASGGETARAHPVNQKMYFDRLLAWGATATGPRNIFYFEAFDEPWKGSDDKWGLFNANRQARYAIQALYPSSLWEAGSYQLTDAVYYIPVAGNTPITANRYSLYSDLITVGEAKPSESTLWNAWENGSTGTATELSNSSSPVDSGKSIELTPRPAVWGWGLALTLPTTAEDLSAFSANGRLNFSIKTTYPGKIEFGFLTGSAINSSLYDVYLPIAPGDYGYQNDGAWHQVSIPISAITPRGAMAFGMTDPTRARLDMTKVTNPFVIADRYAVTGKATSSNITTKIQVDGIYWSR